MARVVQNLKRELQARDTERRTSKHQHRRHAATRVSPSENSPNIFLNSSSSPFSQSPWHLATAPLLLTPVSTPPGAGAAPAPSSTLQQRVSSLQPGNFWLGEAGGAAREDRDYRTRSLESARPLSTARPGARTRFCLSDRDRLSRVLVTAPVCILIVKSGESRNPELPPSMQGHPMAHTRHQPTLGFNSLIQRCPPSPKIRVN